VANDWTWKAGDGNTYQYIMQPDVYFYRLSFRGPATTYYIDDMSLVKSMIGGVDYNNDVIRVDFGYQTNIAELAQANGIGQLVLPEGMVSVRGYDPYYGEEFDLDPLFVEYHNDGYMYLWLEEDCGNFENLRVSFTNSDDPAYQLKYNGSLYPKANDAEWVAAGKIVPDFENELAVANPLVFALPMDMVPPSVVDVRPDDSSFGLDASKPEHRQVKVTFDKSCYTGNNGVTASLTGPGITGFILEMGPYDSDENSIVFTFPSAVPTTLNGDYTLILDQIKSYANGNPAEPVKISLSYGEVSSDPPIYYMRGDFDSQKDNTIPFGFIAIDATGTHQNGESSNGSGLRHYPEGSDFYRCFYLGPRQGATYGQATYGEISDYTLFLEAGRVRVRFMYTGWETRRQEFTFSFYDIDDEANPLISEKLTPTAAHWREGGAGTAVVVTDADLFSMDIEIPSDGLYVMKWRIDASGWTGIAFGNVEVSNCYSRHREWLMMYENAYNTALAVKNDVMALQEKYSGADFDAFTSEVIDLYEGFTSTSPKEWTAAINDGVSRMRARMAVVDKFYTEYQAAIDKEAVYTDSVGYNELVAYTALVAKIAEYDGLDVTVKTGDELTAITAEVTAATKAMTDRCTAIDNFNRALAGALNVLENQTEYDMLPEYAQLQEVYNEWKDLDIIASMDEDLTGSTAALNNARKFYTYASQSIAAQTVQVKGLYALAAELEVDFDGVQEGLADEIADRMNNLRTDDQDLAALLKEILKYRVYELLSDESYADTLNLTPFITNYNLYTTAKIDVEVEHYNYSYGAPNNRWRLKPGVFTTVYPGWTVTGISGNVHVCSEAQNWNDKAEIVDGYIAFDWSSKFEMEQTLRGLPEGLYTIGVGLNNQIATTILVGTADDNLPDTVLIASSNSSYPAVANVFVDSLEVKDSINAKVVVTGGNGWGRIDNWELYLIGKSSQADYAALAAAQKRVAAEQATFVPSIRTTAPVSYRYFTVDGVETDASNSGILIRVSTGADGRRTVEKVIVR
jgi:hypothetical protein